jgi:hypothetical protein
MNEIINSIQSESLNLHIQYYEEVRFICSAMHHKNKASLSMRYAILQGKQLEKGCIPLWSISSTHV